MSFEIKITQLYFGKPSRRWIVQDGNIMYLDNFAREPDGRLVEKRSLTSEEIKKLEKTLENLNEIEFNETYDSRQVEDGFQMIVEWKIGDRQQKVSIYNYWLEEISKLIDEVNKLVKKENRLEYKEKDFK